MNEGGIRLMKVKLDVCWSNYMCIDTITSSRQFTILLASFENQSYRFGLSSITPQRIQSPVDNFNFYNRLDNND